jgi:hypothetical protein
VLFKEVYNNVVDDSEDVLFFDEMHASNNILPLYGYSKACIPCYINEAVDHRAFSLLFAFSKHGDMYYVVHEGAMNTIRCQKFIDSLPQKSRLIMDNLAIHKAVKLNDGIKIFTPVAQPYANPAEIIFSKIKTLFRSINYDNREMKVKDKLELAISKLTFDDFIGAIEHVKTFVNDNY